MRDQATKDWDRIMRRQLTGSWKRIAKRQLTGGWARTLDQQLFGRRRSRHSEDRLGLGEILADQLFGSYHND